MCNKKFFSELGMKLKSMLTMIVVSDTFYRVIKCFVDITHETCVTLGFLTTINVFTTCQSGTSIFVISYNCQIPNTVKFKWRILIPDANRWRQTSCEFVIVRGEPCLWQVTFSAKGNVNVAGFLARIDERCRLYFVVVQINWVQRSLFWPSPLQPLPFSFTK